MANDNKGSSFLKVFGVIAGIAVVIGIAVLILYLSGAFGGGGDNGGDNGGNNGGGGNGGNGGNNGKRFVIAVEDSQYVRINDNGNMVVVNNRSQATEVQKEDSAGEKPNDNCPDRFPDSVTTFRLKVPSKSGNKNYLRASYDSGDKYVVAYTDKAGKENRWAVNSKRLISSAGLGNSGANNSRVPGLMPKLENGNVNFYVKGDCDDLGDNVRLVDANSSN
jgi:hypothetical protein